MDPFDLLAVALTLTAAFVYLNSKTLRLPTTIGVMIFALVFSLAINAVALFVPSVGSLADRIVGGFEFDDTLMHGMLGFLLFAGALHVNAEDLSRQRLLIGTLATFGIAVSTCLVGFSAWGMFSLMGLPVSPVFCFLFGALIAPTDPVAVLSVLKRVGAPKDLTAKMAGESLFNDGVGVVLFLALLEIAVGTHGLDVSHLAELFLVEAVGGAVFGAVVGFLAFLAFRSIDDYHVEVLLSLALAAGAYSAATALHLSGPIAMVVIGLLIGNRGRVLAMSEETVARLDDFWELIDETLNAILFLLIGLEVLVLTFTGKYLVAGLIMFPIVLLVRGFSVALPVTVFRWWREIRPRTVRILTWGGLKGGISVALALSIPARSADGELLPDRDVILATTYVVVICSVLIQGLTFGPVVRRLLKADSNSSPPPSEAPH